MATTGRGIDLTAADLSGLDLSGFDLRRATLNRTALYGTDLTAADLTGASLVCAGLERTNFTDATLHGAYVHALAAQASVFVRADLTGLIDATGALFHGCNMSEARLDQSELAGVTFYQCNLASARAKGADLRGAVFNECRMDDADLSSAVVGDCAITRCGLRGMVLDRARGRGMVIQRPSAADTLRLSGACLPNLRLSEVRAQRIVATELSAVGIDVLDSQLVDANFRGADLTGGRWSHVCLDRANFADAALADSWWHHVSACEATVTEATGESMTATECSFARANFSGFAGRYATFRNCDFNAADLQRAYLYRASFIGDPPASACMSSVNLDGANLTQAYLAADFTEASLRHVTATYARVNQSIFSGADLSGLSMFRASAVKTDFTRAQVSGTLGLMFADRCTGLLAALAASDDPESLRLTKFVNDFEALIASDTRKST
ncbi:pentapeptide repeat-containing protein [Nocardia sp. NPDC004654]|uniref:pentapeptide repeat-containing protein n=1 Tax=Nocardia sp. NPDC004654 TaxID=3154776 RepID=UPI0033A8CD87